MAYITTTRFVEVGLRDRVAVLSKAVKDAMARRRVYRQTLRELGALSSRELADLGIHRSMITRLAVEAANAK